MQVVKYKYSEYFGSMQFVLDESLSAATAPTGLGSQRDERLTARFRQISKPRDSGLDLFNHSDIWQVVRQQDCRDAGQISERYDHYNIQSRGFKTSWIWL